MNLFINFEQYLTLHKTKQLALFHAIRDAILNGKLHSHDQLPPTRTLARQLTLSRGTVNNVYEMLLAQGYLYSKVGSGVFVNDYELSMTDTSLSNTTPMLSKWGQSLLANTNLLNYRSNTKTVTQSETELPSLISFVTNKVNFDDFPLSQWNKVMFEHIRSQYAEDEMIATPAAGDLSLREAIKKQLYVHRGIDVDANQIVIVNGSLQALALLSHLFIDEGDYVAFENPHYAGMRTSVEILGGKIETYPVDDHGILFNPSEHQHYKLIYLTPNRQFPTGAVLSMERRQALLQWAYLHQCFIIEDDYDSEFSYTNRAIEPLKALDLAEQVVYIGSFSRTMMQHIRIGYAVLPKKLVEPFVNAKMLFERLPTAVIQQRALASFMELGYYDRHQRRLRRIYRDKAYFFQNQLFSKTSHFLNIRPLSAGLHIFVEWKSSVRLYPLFLDQCHQLNVKVVNAEYMYYHSPKPSFCLGFAHLDHSQIEEGVDRLLLAYNTIVSSSQQ